MTDGRRGGRRCQVLESKTGPLILVVDDFGPAREVYEQVLSTSGYRVAVATDVVEAIEKSVTLRPELVLMDLAMPGQDGWEAMRQLKGDDRTRSARIVVLTGLHNAAGAKRAKRAGCDAYLVKPCLPETLLRVVRGVLAERSH